MQHNILKKKKRSATASVVNLFLMDGVGITAVCVWPFASSL